MQELMPAIHDAPLDAGSRSKSRSKLSTCRNAAKPMPRGCSSCKKEGGRMKRGSNPH